jgi:protein ImuB
MADWGADRSAVCWVPDFPVLAVGADPDAAVLVASGQGPRRIVVACSSAARTGGVRRGQKVRDAQRLFPQIEVLARDEAAEARAFEPVLAAVEDVAAGVELVRPGLIALDARGPARFHGGEARLGVLLRDAIAQVPTAAGGFHGAGVGLASGIFAASLAARKPGASDPVIVPAGGSAAFLAPFPIAVLGRPQLAETLHQLGVRTLGAFAALPAAQVAGRFGADGTLAHRLARGLDPRPPAARRPPEELGVVHEFDPPEERDEPVAFVAKALADRMHAALASAGLACVRVGIEVTTLSGRTNYRVWRHADAAGVGLTSPALSQRVRWQLDGWRSQDPYPHLDPVAALRLVPDQLVVDAGSQQALWGREEVPDRVARAAERVQALLGHDAVLRLHPVGGRDPAGRIALVPWGDLPDPGAHPDPAAPWPGAVPPPSPPTVPLEPIPVDLLDATGRPVAVSGRARLSGPPARLVLGGERLEVTGWAGPWPFDTSPWEAAARRRVARLQCSTRDGRAFLLALTGGAWRVEGVYQ